MYWRIISIAFFLVNIVSSQTAGPAPTYIYTYAGQSAAPSLLSAISSAAAGPNSLNGASGGKDSATALVPAFPTTTTVGPVNIPQLTGSNVFTSAASGEIFPTATRAPYTIVGTYNTTLPSSTAALPVAVRSGSSKIEYNFGMILAGFVAGVVTLLA